MSILSIKTKE